MQNKKVIVRIPQNENMSTLSFQSKSEEVTFEPFHYLNQLLWTIHLNLSNNFWFVSCKSFNSTIISCIIVFVWIFNRSPHSFPLTNILFFIDFLQKKINLYKSNLTLLNIGDFVGLLLVLFSQFKYLCLSFWII